jgi:oligopeptide transport system substrate-binding protein
MKLALSLSLALLFLFTSCRKPQDHNGKKIITINLRSNVDSLDPAISYDTVSSSIVYQLYESLYQYHYLKRPYQLEPLLAEGPPSISADKKTYTFKIKKNVRYHDSPALKGKPRYVKAQDFVTQIKRLAWTKTRSNGWFLFDGVVEGLNEFREKTGSSLEEFKKATVSGLSTPDDHTLVIKLTRPYPQLTYAFGMSFTAPIPIEAVEHFKNMLGQVEIGSGPFTLTDYASTHRANLKKFEHYRETFYPGQGDRYANHQGLLKDAGKKIPFLDEIKFKVIKEEQTRWLEFKAGKLDLLIIPKDQFDTAIGKDGKLSPSISGKGIELQMAPSLTYWWIAFNMQDSVIGKNKALRMAIAHAIDFNRYIQLFTNNTGQRAYSIYVPGIPGYTPSNKIANSYDLERAKKLMKQAGHPHGNGLPTLTYDARGNSTTDRQRAAFFKSEMAKIGIRLKVNLNTFPGFMEKQRKGNLQISLDGWALDYPDAENILQLLSTKNHPPGPNASYFSDPRFDKMFNELKILEEGEGKHLLMNKMEMLVHEQLPWVLLYYDRRYMLHYNYVKNYRYSPIINNFVKYLNLKKTK